MNKRIETHSKDNLQNDTQPHKKHSQGNTPMAVLFIVYLTHAFIL